MFLQYTTIDIVNIFEEKRNNYLFFRRLSVFPDVACGSTMYGLNFSEASVLYSR